MRLTPPLSSAVILIATGTATGQVTLPGIVHQWSAEGSAEDAVGYAHGVLIGDVGYSEGWCGHAFLFGGGFIDFGNEAGNFGTSDFTVSFWIRASYPPKHAVLEKRSECSVSPFWDIRVWPDASGTLAAISAGNPFYQEIATDSVSDGTWHHYALRRTGVDLEVFIDGAWAGTDTETDGVVDVVSSAHLIAGHSACEQGDGTLPLIGELDEIQVYHRALSTVEIQMLAAVDQMCPCLGDTDGDGVVSVSDLLLVLAQWGACPPDCPGDANLDGTVDVIDLLLVLAAWGPCS